MLDGAEVIFRLVEHVQPAFPDREVRAVKLELSALLAIRDPGKGP
jgi:hypothetical protein